MVSMSSFNTSDTNISFPMPELFKALEYCKYHTACSAVITDEANSRYMIRIEEDSGSIATIATDDTYIATDFYTFGWL